MGLLIRTLLIWLLALALPVQAAARTTTLCDSKHDGVGRGALSWQGEAAVRTHHGHASQIPHDHHGVAAQSDGEASDSSAIAAPGKLVEDDTHSCCFAGAILSVAPAVPVPRVSATVFVAVVASVDALAAGAPDRPPRILLA